MQLRDDADFSTIDWSNQAILTRRQAEALPPGPKREAEIDRVLACKALAHSGRLLLQGETLE
jgi:hypothetical protein